MAEGSPPEHLVDGDLDRSLRARILRAWQLEFANLWWHLLVCNLLARLLPEGRAPRLRTVLVRGIGFQVGAGTRFSGMPKLQSTSPGVRKSRLRIGADCNIGTGVILEFGANLIIGDRVSIGDRAVVLTTTHELGRKECRAGPPVSHPTSIGDGAEIGANAIILPGVTLGTGARVLPGSVVTRSVAPGATVEGNPARPQRTA